MASEAELEPARAVDAPIGGWQPLPGAMGRPPCPACGACAPEHDRPTNVLSFRNGLRLPAFHCLECDHRWLVTTEESQRRIERGYDHDYAGFRVDPYFQRVVAAEIRERLGVLEPPPALLLDVGCGSGEFLLLAKQAGYAVSGVDVSPSAGELCRAKGIDVMVGDFLTLDFAARFDIVTMWDVLEHLREPGAVVARALGLLAPEGFLVLKVPKKTSLNFRLLRALPARGGTLLGAPNHVQFFGELSLGRLLARAGFAEIMWLDGIRFRSRPRTLNPRKLAGRALARIVGSLAGDGNLYAIASANGFSPTARRDVAYRLIAALGERERGRRRDEASGKPGGEHG